MSRGALAAVRVVGAAWLAGTLAAACETSSGGAGASAGPDPDAWRFTFDVGPHDAAPPADAVPDAAPPDPAVCDALCGQLATCAGEDDPGHLCDGIDARELDAFKSLCSEVCLGEPLFAPSFAGRTTCDLLLSQMRAASPDLAYACVPNPPPETPACATFAARTSECVGEACENAVPVEAGLAYWLKLSCDQSVAAGQLAPDRLATLPGADTPCDEPVAEALVSSLIGAIGAPGTLTSLCFTGPSLPPGTCGAACEHLRPCLPPRNPLRNTDYCAFLCAIDPSLEAILSCAATAPECGPLSTCFGP